MKKLSLICAMLLLAACGSDTQTSSPPDVPTPPPTPSGPVADAFFTTVKTTVAAMPDDSEAVAIDATASTAPEDTEPSPL
ncbi:hypothetical protein [Massilia sp. CCM 8734]|uniref:hypothetical protein n=1 Tax=Massilia sp. CCM 8734 TaxID=2609283 RepID=UPI00141FBF7C|nr:hypothetical protein [Massilia sp. CCM 8734]NHZ96514.1 hypothetical protein [Massilia sp. CCM 8734]